MSLFSSRILRRPWLWLPSQVAHDVAPYFLPLLSQLSTCKNRTWHSKEWRGLHFANPIGLAGGVDKTGQSLPAWDRLGAGFLEVGTITPEPQGPNPGKIMDRDPNRESLWNQMGFPNAGSLALKKRLAKQGRPTVPLFVNVGKNRWTDNSQASEDYTHCMSELKEFADVFVINVSSPNTKGLRDLLSEEHLKTFLQNLSQTKKSLNLKQPFLLKLSPDMDSESLKQALVVSAEFVDGWILTNTTRSRYDNCPFPEDRGGMSGVPLQDLSRQALAAAASVKQSHPEKLLISVGGVNSPEEIQKRLHMGADLVQVYSALIYEGPMFFKKTLRHLQQNKT